MKRPLTNRIFFFFAMCVLAAVASGAWYADSNWTRRQEITIDASVTPATLTDFPYLIKISDPSNPLFTYAQANGDDILFTLSDGTTQLDHEIEEYDSATGELWAWVKIPSLSSASDTVLYIYYGNGAASNQESAAAVWSNGYVSVYHLHDDFNDSVGGNNGTNTGSVDTTGRIADGQEFIPAGGVDQVSLGSWNVSGNQLTVQGWINPDTFAQDDPRVLAKATDESEQGHIWMLSLFDGSSGENRLRGRLKTGTSDIAGTTTLIANAGSGDLSSTGQWYHAAMTYDGATMRLVKDGSDVGSTSKSGNLRQNSWVGSIGNNPGNISSTQYSWDGKLDEIRISSTARSTSWLTAETRNQSNPATYQSLGAEGTNASGTNQSGYAWSPDTATFSSIGNDTPLNFAANTVYVIAIQIKMTASVSSGDWDLQVREDGAGSWLKVANFVPGNSQVWQTTSSHTFAKSNGDTIATSEFGHTTAPSGFSAVESEFGDRNQGITEGFSGTNIYSELQYTIEAEPEAIGHTYEFRVNYEGADLDGYEVYAQAGIVASISGTVFEDVNYGGGAGRTMAASSGVARSGARVELFNAAGTFVTFTTTDGSGDYSFSGLTAGDYTVRVVNNTVTSSRTGYTTSALPVQTFRTSATSGAAIAVTDHVGGETPNLADAGNGSTTLAALTTGSTTAQSISAVTLGTSDITGLDFGFNFDTIVNVNDTGQGSLRQFIANANLLSGDASLAQSGLVAAKENAVFMISNGTAAAGLRAANDYFSAGVATIDVASGFTISTPMVLNAQIQPGWASSPVVELNGGGAGVVGLTVTAGSSTLRGFAINRFGSHGISLSVNGGNTIAGCYIGTNAAGSATEPNTGYGISISGSPSNIIGGTNASDQNIISGNSYGVFINGADSTGNTVLGNTIGLAADGTSPLGNSAYGIRLSGGAHTNTIGGTTTGSRNVISANTLSGIGILSASTANNVILGNFIGTDANGLAPLGNSIGIYVSGADNTIGGTTTEARNVISGNDAYGIYVYGSAATGTQIQGNHIGADAAGTADLGNANHGIYIAASASGNTVGGTAEGAGNLIRFNSGRGVVVANTSTGNAISGNSIYENTSLGIDLGENGLTANNGTTNASLPNYEMDHPVFTGAALDGDTLHVSGYVGSAPDQATFAGARVEVFESDEDASGFGEGKTYLGALTADASGNFSGTLDVTGKGLAIGESLTGTATDGSNNTSEFGANATVTGLPTLSVTKLSYVISDPSNNTTNPKRIPGAVVEYHLIAQNSGDGPADADTIVLTDTIDATTLTYHVTSGVTFTDGTTSSSLSLGPVTYSQTAAPGPYVYDYTPVPDGNGYDDNVTAIRVGTTGSFDFGGDPAPSFTLKFRVKVK